MRETDFLHYLPGNSLYHRHDARLKIAELAVWSMTALTGSPLVLIVLFTQLAVFSAVSGMKFSRLRRALVFWLIMALAITVSSGLSSRGDFPGIGPYTLPLGKQGLLRGAIQSLRLLTVLLAGQLFSSFTDPAETAEALRRLTAFLPASWSSNLSSAVSLTIAFIPRIIDESATVRDAALSRALGERRSIFRRALALGLPLADATLRKADITSEALLSRCYTSDATPPLMSIRPRDIVLTFALVILPGIAVLL